MKAERYCLKPLEVYACQWNGDNVDDAKDILVGVEYEVDNGVLYLYDYCECDREARSCSCIEANPTDWIVRYDTGEIFVVGDEDFAKRYTKCGGGT